MSTHDEWSDADGANGADAQAVSTEPAAGATAQVSSAQGTTAQATTAQVTLAEVREEPLSVDEVLAAVRHPRAGGIATFIGVVREQDHGHEVNALDYSAHPTATEVLLGVAEQVAAGGDVIRVAAVHRTGHLEVGDLAVVAAVSAQHRGAAFAACRELIDTLKTTVPIWKHQMFADGSQEWVGMP